MTKIYEALEQAKKKRQLEKEPDERKNYFSRLAEQYRDKEATPPPSVPDQLRLKTPLKSLYQNITVLLPDDKCKIIQFISARPKEGTSLLIGEFAKLVALQFEKKVLLVEVEPGSNKTLPSFNLDASSCWLDTIKQKRPIRDTIIQVSNTNLYVSRIMSSAYSTPIERNSKELNSIFEELENDFDFILIDSPSRLAYSETAMISKHVSGFIIVVEAEKTRWQVVDKLKSNLTDQGGKILGVVLNKRKFPIPELIYKHL